MFTIMTTAKNLRELNTRLKDKLYFTGHWINDTSYPNGKVRAYRFENDIYGVEYPIYFNSDEDDLPVPTYAPYAVIDEYKDRRYDIWVDTFDTLSAARKYADCQWFYLTDREKKNRKLTVCGLYDDIRGEYWKEYKIYSK